MIILCTLFFIFDNYLYSALKSTINDHVSLPRRMLHFEITDRKLSFTSQDEFTDSKLLSVVSYET